MEKKYKQSEETGILKDKRDGKTYKTITIGSVTVMAENLAYKTSEGCFAMDNKEGNVAEYGYLYDWNTAIKVADGIKGWHLPSDKEWRALLAYLGNPGEAFDILKASGEPENSTGFNALPAGFYSPVLPFADLGKHAYFWSRTRHGEKNICNLSLDFEKGTAECTFQPHYYGFSVRLIKNRMFNHLFGNV